MARAEYDLDFLSAARREHQRLAVQPYEVMKATPPNMWYREMRKRVQEVRKNFSALPEPTQNYLGPIIPHAQQLLRQESVVWRQQYGGRSLEPEDEKEREELYETIALRADSIIMAISIESAKGQVSIKLDTNSHK